MGFEQCHPAVNLIYFIAVIFGTLSFRHPVFLAISLFCACAYAIWRARWKAAIMVLVLPIPVVAYALYYATFHHFGITPLGELFTGNSVTLESLTYGLVRGMCVAGVVVWLICVYSIFSSDKVVYLFGRVSPRLSLFLSILLRMVPRIGAQARRINRARRGIGRACAQGTFFQRIAHCISLFSVLITWTIEAFATASDSMRCRGSSLRGRRAFSVYRFDNRDRAYVIVMFFCLTVTVMGQMLGQVDMQYNPQLIFPKFTAASPLFFAGYTFLCLMPLLLEMQTQYRFARARRKIDA